MGSLFNNHPIKICIVFLEDENLIIFFPFAVLEDNQLYVFLYLKSWTNLNKSLFGEEGEKKISLWA